MMARHSTADEINIFHEYYDGMPIIKMTDKAKCNCDAVERFGHIAIECVLKLSSLVF